MNATLIMVLILIAQGVAIYFLIKANRSKKYAEERAKYEKAIDLLKEENFHLEKKIKSRDELIKSFESNTTKLEEQIENIDIDIDYELSKLRSEGYGQ